MIFATRPRIASRLFRSRRILRQYRPLELAGREYYEYRAALMVKNDQGLTTTYNRFHDPEERDPK